MTGVLAADMFSLAVRCFHTDYGLVAGAVTGRYNPRVSVSVSTPPKPSPYRQVETSHSRKADMNSRFVTTWSLTILGGVLVFLSSLLTVLDDGPLTIDILERALPFLVGVGLISANYWLQHQGGSTRRVRRVSPATAFTAVVFCGVVWWILFLVGLEAPIPDAVDYIYLNASAIGALTGSVLGYQYSRLQDEQARLDALTEELEQTNAKLQGKVERLDEFAGIVSHDLRNPLNVATGYLDLAQNDLDPDTYEKIDRALTRAETITIEMLELARQGRTVTDPGPVDLQEVAEQAWRSVSTGDVELTVADTWLLMADGNRLQQLFENLYRNTIEHGGPDLTTVAVGTLEKEGFYVEDDGQGFPTDHPEELFEPGVTTTTQGTGYGLAIVNSITEAHGWQLKATTSERGGARVEITNVNTQSE